MDTEKLINEIILSMNPHLSSNELIILRDVLANKLKDVEIKSTELCVYDNVNDHLIDLFIACKSLEGLSNNTLRQYRYAINRFINMMNVNVIQCDVNHIRAYLAKLVSNGNSKVSINNARAYLSSFFEWLSVEGYIERNIVLRIKKTKVEKRERATLSHIDVEKIHRACINNREKAVIDLLESTGMRCNEIANFKISDINFLDKTIVIHGKGSKDRIGYITPSLQISLQTYLESRGYESDYIFGRTRGDHGKMSNTAVENMVKKIAYRAGVNDVVIHKFRHYFCTELCRRGMSIQEVQVLMGHSSIETTAKVYNHINNDDMAHSFIKYCA